MVDLSIPSDCTPTDGENSYFKVTVARSWSDANWGYSALQSNWTNVENNDNNLNLPITETNIYALSVNTVAMSITQTPIGKTLGWPATSRVGPTVPMHLWFMTGRQYLEDRTPRTGGRQGVEGACRWCLDYQLGR